MEHTAMSDDDWTVLEDDIADAIDCSMDIDWTASVGARAIVEMLKGMGYVVTPNPDWNKP